MRHASGLLVVGLVVVAALPAAAQPTATGRVSGVARDEHGAVIAGVVVTATSATVPGVRIATTERTGEYRLIDLPPGDYTLIGEFAGFAKFQRAPVTVRAGLHVEVDLLMRVGSVDETIDVRQETPLLETRAAAQAVNISGELLRAIPLSERREWFGALMVAPGVTTAEWVNNERLIYVHGADQTANVVQIDGADVTAAARPGLGYLNLSTDAVDDIQIKTSGVDASAPLGIGGIVNIATASGTDRLRGAGTVFVQPRSWNDANTPGGTSSTADQTQVDASLGAPIRRGRIWGFGAYRFSDVATGVSRSAAQLQALRALVSGFEPFDTVNTSHFWFAKVTAQPAPAHQLVAFYQEDVNPVLVAVATTANPFDEATGGMAASARVSSTWSGRLTTRLAASYNDKRREVRDSQVDGPLERVFQSTIASGGRLTGNGSLVNRGSPVLSLLTQPNAKLTLSFDATFVAAHGSSTHELQAGLYAQSRVQGNHQVYVNGGFNLEDSVLRRPDAIDGGVIPFHRQVMNGPELTAFRTRGRDYAVYLQDAWRPGSRLTLNAGVRVDRIVVRDVVFGVTSQRSTEIGPRLGINYALTADNRNVARAHWARVHDQPGLVTTVGTVGVGQRDLYDLDLDGTFETVFDTPATFAVTPNRIVDPDLHQPSIDEWGAGYSRQLDSSVAARVDVVHRRYADRPTLVETNGRYDGRMFAGYADERFNEIFTATNNRWNSPVYRSLELSLSKRTPRVQGIASYVRQWRHLDGTWQPNDPASFIQPGAFANDRGIGSTTGTSSAATDANSLSGTQMTLRSTASAQWQDHAVRAGVTINAPWALLLASSYTFQSGAWSGPIVTRLAAADPAFGPPTIRLSNGRTVTNPLATLIRFAFPTRGDGQLRTPVLHTWNVRVGRRFAWRGTKLDASLDVFNLTNNGADLGFEPGANQTYNPLFGITTFRQLPRSAQAGLRVSF